jgi:hypothetical protein
MILLPPSIPDDDLIAKCSPRGAGNGGNVVWTSMFASYSPPIPNMTPPSIAPRGKVPMAYKMEHWSSTKRNYRTIDNICITNLYCGVGKGWDIIVEGTIVQHEDHKTDAQREAEKLLEGKC